MAGGDGELAVRAVEVEDPSAQVREGAVDVVAMTLHGSQHAAMADDEDQCRPDGRRAPSARPVEGAGQHLVVVLEAVRPAMVGQVAGPPRLDLVAVRPGPLSCVSLPEAGIGTEGRPDCGGDDLRRAQRPRQIARPDRIHAGKPATADSGLPAAELAERRVGVALPPADGVPRRLAMADDEHTGGGHPRPTVATVRSVRPATTVVAA